MTSIQWDQIKHMLFTDIFTEPYIIKKKEYTGKLRLNEFISKSLNGHFETQFSKDIVRNHSIINGIDKIDYFQNKGKNDFTYYSDLFDTFIKQVDSDITHEYLETFKKLNVQNVVLQLSGLLVEYFSNYGIIFRIDGEHVNLTYTYTLKDDYKLKVTCTCQLLLSKDFDIMVVCEKGEVSMLFDLKQNSYTGYISFDIDQLHFINDNLFIEPYNIDKHEYTGKLPLNSIIFINTIDLLDNVEYYFTKDITRLNYCTVNGSINKASMINRGITKGSSDISDQAYVSNNFIKFIKLYVNDITPEDIKTFKLLHTQNFQSLITSWFILNLHCIVLTTSPSYAYTLEKDNYKLQITAKHTFITGPDNIIGNGSSSILFDITNNSYSANIELHIPPQPEPASQDDCFTFVKRLFGRTGGTRKKSKVYGMPYTYRKVYRKKCYKVSNRLTKRVFAKCTTKKKALKQLRLLRYLESK